MFDLNKKIARWRLALARAGGCQPDELNELETHLRDAFEKILESGISNEEAFMMATKQLGDPVELGMEYQKSRGVVYRMASSPVVIVLLVAVSHFLMHLSSVLFSFGASMNYFESGAEATVGLQILHAFASILAFPLVLLIQHLPIAGTGHWGWLIFLANSLLWGLAVWICLTRIRKLSITGQCVATRTSQAATQMP